MVLEPLIRAPVRLVRNSIVYVAAAPPVNGDAATVTAETAVAAEAADAVPTSEAITAAAMMAIFIVRTFRMDTPVQTEHPSRTPLPMLVMVIPENRRRPPWSGG